MSIYQKVKEYLTGKKNTVDVSEEYCPNCWGRQEYEGGFRKAIHNESIDLNNLDRKKGWIDAYAVRNFEGIKLQKENSELVCSICKVSYQA